MCLSVQAQFVAKKVIFEHPGPFTQEQLQTASHLKPGTSFSKDDLQNSAQALIDTGAFDQLSPELDGPIKEMTVTFKLQPSKLLPVHYENFVWLTPEELEAGLKRRVPLYVGKVPDSGNLQDQIRSALVAILADKGVQATVTATEVAPTVQNPADSVTFAVTAPEVVLDAVTLHGVEPEMEASIQTAVAKVVHTPYVSGETEAMLLEAYRQKGYLKSSLDHEEHRLQPQDASGAVKVQMMADVVPGQIYTVKRLLWEGSPQLSAAEFADKSPLHAGDVASTQGLEKAARLIEDAYKKQGYLYVAVDPQPAFEEATHTVSYAFQVTPGDQYHVQSVQLLGLSPQQLQMVQQNWKMQRGSYYDPNYVTAFAQQNTALMFLAGYNASFEARADASTKLVDLVVTFRPGVKQGK